MKIQMANYSYINSDSKINESYLAKDRDVIRAVIVGIGAHKPIAET